MRKFLVVIALIIVLVGGLAGVKALQIRSMIDAGKSFSIPPETVGSAPVRTETWTGRLGAVGSVSAVQGVLLRAELAGTVRRIAFESGDTAAAGQVLVQCDTSAEEAQLAAAVAAADLARQNLVRARDLRAQNVVSQSELDAADAALRQTTGTADQVRAVIAKKTIRAPFAGRLGIRAVNLGQFVNAGDPIVSLQSLDPVYVDFTLPEQDLARIERGLPVRVTTDAAPGRVFEGRVTASDPQLDAATRNVRVQATLPNPSGSLRPGLFARIELVLPQSRRELVVPATAVLHAPYGDSVFVLEPAKDKAAGAAFTAKMVTVRLGESRGDFVAVTSGLAEGQVVAASGVFKLRNGSAVVVDDALAPKASADPHPADS